MVLPPLAPKAYYMALRQASPVPHAPDHAELLLAGQQMAPSAGYLATQLASTCWTWQLGCVSGALAEAMQLALICRTPVGSTAASDDAACRAAPC